MQNEDQIKNEVFQFQDTQEMCSFIQAYLKKWDPAGYNTKLFITYSGVDGFIVRSERWASCD